MKKKTVTLDNRFSIGTGHPLTIMCGPCVIESEELCMTSAAFLKKLCSDLHVNLIFKASYDKANRSSYNSFRGPGIEEGLRILRKVQKEYDLPVVTDVHTIEEAQRAGEVCEVLQIPAFLCRQTDIVFSAAQTGRVINVKKGQFLAPWDMSNVVGKIVEAGNENIILTDRGTTFGYNNLVSDMRAIPLMQRLGFPVCFDATHSVQLPGGQGETTGGQREFVPILAKAALAAGADCLFIEIHPNPKEAKSDASSVIDFKDLPELLRQLSNLYNFIQQQQHS